MATKGLALNVKIGAALDKTFKSTTLFAGNSIEKLAQKSKSLKDAKANLSKFKDIGLSLSSQQSKLQAAKLSFAQLGNQMQSTLKPTKSLSRSFDKAKRQVELLEGVVNDKRKSLNSVGLALNKAGIKTHNLGAEESRLAKEITRVEKTMNRKQRTMQLMSSGLRKAKFAVIGTVGALSALGAVGYKVSNALGNHGDHVAKTADKLGISTTKLQAFRYAAERSGVSTENLDKSLEFMQKSIVDVSNGTGEAKVAFEKMGLSAEELKNLKPDQALAVIAESLKGVTNKTERLRYATQIFGRSGAGMVNMLKDGEKGLKDYAKEAQNLGYILDEKTLRAAEKNRDAFLNMTTTFKAVGYQVGAKLMPIFTEGFKKIANWVSKNKDLIGQWASKILEVGIRFIPVFINGIKSLASSLTIVGQTLNTVVGYLGGWKPVVTVLVGLLGLRLVAALTGVTKSIGLVGGAIKVLSKLFLMNPIGLAITAIGTSAFLIYKYWQPIKAFFINLWDAVKSVFSGAANFLSNIWDGYVGQVKKNINFVKSIFTELWDGIKTSATEAFSWVGDKVSWLGDKIKGVLEYFGFAKAESKRSEAYIKSNYHDNTDQFKSLADEKAAVLAARRSPMQQAIKARNLANQTTHNDYSRANSSIKKTVNVTNQITVAGGVSTPAITMAAQQGTQKALALYDTDGGF
ncbi:hypothetical protein L3V82_12655 [Thiotrichales bacterium 19S3-7]|nr:hypothetical protein [Thiotrichales bacterium 19S3-7]MCF6803024.1 hypothetical protein [Thiotrichales bacterium 19S3-11]